MYTVIHVKHRKNNSFVLFISLLQQSTSPLAQVAEARGGGGGGPAHAPGANHQTTTTTEALTTPILSLATPNIFSSLPPLFSSIMGDFPFGQMGQIPGGASAGGTAGMATSGNPGGGGGGGGGDGGSSAALVAFPVSIQPSASGAGMGNLVLQAQNMGQPFLLTPTYDRSSHPLLNSQGAPPSSLASGNVNPNMMKDLEQLKQQYERTTQLIQQQLLLSQMSMMHQHQQQSQQQQQTAHHPGEVHVEGAGGSGGNGATTQVNISGGGGAQGTGQGVTGAGGGGSDGGPPTGPVVVDDHDGRLRSQESEANVQAAANQFINGSDVMIGSRSQSDSLLRRTREVAELDGEDLASKRPRLDTSVSAL